MPADAKDITALLKAWARGEPTALDELTPLVYEQLRRMASRQMRRERPGHELQTTALVHETYLRLAKTHQLEWQDRVHFFAVSTRMMRRILVESARKQATAKRGGDLQRDAHSSAFDFDAVPAPDTERAAELCALDDALEILNALDPRRAQVVELRYFGGLSVEETAAALGISTQTVMRDWKVARAWLMNELNAPTVD